MSGLLERDFLGICSETMKCKINKRGCSVSLCERNKPPFASSKCRNSGNMISKNKQMDIVGALVGQHRLQVHHMTHDGVLAGDAHAAMDLPGLTRNLQRHVHVVSLGQ